MRKDSVSKLARTANVESISPILWKRAGQLNVSLPPEVARHIAQNVRSRESELRSALMRVVADFSVTGTEITRNERLGISTTRLARAQSIASRILSSKNAT